MYAFLRKEGTEILIVTLELIMSTKIHITELRNESIGKIKN